MIRAANIFVTLAVLTGCEDGQSPTPPANPPIGAESTRGSPSGDAAGDRANQDRMDAHLVVEFRLNGAPMDLRKYSIQAEAKEGSEKFTIEGSQATIVAASGKSVSVDVHQGTDVRVERTPEDTIPGWSFRTRSLKEGESRVRFDVVTGPLSGRVVTTGEKTAPRIRVVARVAGAAEDAEILESIQCTLITRTDDSGAYRFPNILAADYEIVTRGDGKPTPEGFDVSESGNFVLRRRARAVVRADAGAAVAADDIVISLCDVRLRLAPADGDGPLADAEVEARAVTERGNPATETILKARLGSDGTVTMRVPDGQWSVKIKPKDAGLPALSRILRIGPNIESNAPERTFAYPNPGSSGSAEAYGTLEGVDQLPKTVGQTDVRWQVSLEPVERHVLEMRFLSVATQDLDETGAFAFRGVQPGVYFVLLSPVPESGGLTDEWFSMAQKYGREDAVILKPGRKRKISFEE